jgi:hypothetical protein
MCICANGIFLTPLCTLCPLPISRYVYVRMSVRVCADLRHARVCVCVWVCVRVCVSEVPFGGTKPSLAPHLEISKVLFP